MINIPISVSISGGEAPYRFTYSSNNTEVSFSNVTGFASLSNSTYYATTDVIYPTEASIATTIVTCTFVDSNGCSKVLTPVIVSNPCTLTNTISTNGEFVFVSTVTGGSPDYTWSWNYDTNLWDKAPTDTSDTDNYLSLVLKSSSTPTSTPITCVVTDVKGCTKYASYAYNFCKPVVLPVTMTLSCQGTSACTGSVTSYAAFDLTRHVTPCSNQVIDWPNMQFTGLSDVCIINNGDGTITVGSTTNVASTKIINFAVQTTSGIVSNYATITINIVACVGKASFSGVPTTLQLTIEDVVGTDKTTNVSSRVAGNPNWSTFTFTNTPSWGTVTFNANRDIIYDITDVATTPTIPDTISWSLQDYSGNQINITDTVLRNRIALPVTVLDVVCNSCGETTAPIDVLVNDTGDIDRSTLYISSSDSDIVVTKDTDNNFTFTSLPGASFNNFLNYRVANSQGAYSTDAIRINVQVACVGTNNAPTLDLTCSVSKVFDIKDQFTGSNSFGDVFLETTPTLPTYASQGGVIVGADGTVTLTGLVNKVYTFQYTAQNVVACSPASDDVGVLTVTHGQSPHVTFATAVDNGNGTSTYTGTYLSNAAPFQVTLNGVVPAYQSGILTTGGNFTFTLYNVAGVNTVVISSTSICGVAISDSDNSLTI